MHYSHQCFYPCSEIGFEVAIRIREHSRINNRNEVLVYILYTHFEGFESSCTSFFFFFSTQLKERSLVRSIQTRIRPKTPVTA